MVVSWTMDNFRVRFMDNFTEKIFKIVKIVHGKFLIFIQTYENSNPNPNPNLNPTPFPASLYKN